MLAGLLFAVVDDDGAAVPGLVAGMPFAGMTVLEHQARLLIAAGVSHIVVLSPMPSVALRAGAARLARRGIAIDLVADAREAVAAVHPLSALVMLADGLIADEAVVAATAAREGEALLVVPADAAPAGLERVGGGGAWAGVARIDPRRLRELADLPRDYAPQSTLLRLVEAAGGERVPLPAGGGIHAIVASAVALHAVEQQRVALAARPGADWFDRFVLAPISRPLVQVLARAHAATGGIAGGAAILAVVALAAVALDHFAIGAVLLLAALLIAAAATTLTALRDESGVRRWIRYGINGVGAVAAVLLALRDDAVSAHGAALPTAIALIVAVALAERSGEAPDRAWGGPASCLAIAALATLIGLPLVGLAATAIYAAAILAMAIDDLRRLARP